jgi:hypothetical protein
VTEPALPEIFRGAQSGDLIRAMSVSGIDMEAAKTPEKASVGSQLAGWVMLCAVVAACAYGWHRYKEGQREVAEANAAVTTNIGTYLPEVFATFTQTVSSEKPLTPDTIYSGKGSRIVAYYERTEPNMFSPDSTMWEVLAQSKSGTYFTLEYNLCTECDASTRGADRISKSDWPVRALTVDDAKDWLFRAGLRKEFRSEFGTDSPPAAVQG